MSRPPKQRRIEKIPKVKFFKPAGVPKRELKEVTLSLEEIEAVRLKDKEGLTQQEAADRMEVSRPTFQRILTSAHRKIAEALTEGKSLKFHGGDYDFRPRCKRCGRDFTPGRNRGRKRDPEVCPECDQQE